MTARSLPPTRRDVLALGGAGVAALVLAACSGDDDSGGSTTTFPPNGSADRSLAYFFGGPQLAAGIESRAPFGVADADGLLPVDQAPASLEVQLLDSDGAAVGGPIQVDRHAEGIPQAYYPLRFTVPAAGIYTARTEVDGVATEMSLKVDDPDDLVVILPGQAVPRTATPTTADAAGVDPICTDDPTCELHGLSLDAALDAKRPIALLVSTPAYCQVQMCGPVLSLVLDQVAAHPDVQFLHTEVYAHPETDPELADHAPIIEALGLHFEPCLVLVHADGTVAERLDNVFDEVELADALGRLTATSQ